MKTLFTLLIAGCLMVPTQALAAARDCGNIHDLSERWDELSTYIDDHSDDGKLRKAEVRKVISELKILIPPTRSLAGVLVNDLKGTEERRMQAVGKQIVAALDEFASLKDDSDDWDDASDIFDRLVDLIANVGEWCEK